LAQLDPLRRKDRAKIDLLDRYLPNRPGAKITSPSPSPSRASSVAHLILDAPSKICQHEV